MDPLTIGMIVASLAGQAMQSRAAQKSAAAKNRAREAAMQAGIKRSREFEKQGFELTRKAAAEELELGEMSEQKKGEALALMAKRNEQAPTTRLGAVQAAQRGQASESAAKVIGSRMGSSALSRRQKDILMPIGEILRNARGDWRATQQQIQQAGANAGGGGGLMTIGSILKMAPLVAGAFSPAPPFPAPVGIGFEPTAWA